MMTYSCIFYIGKFETVGSVAVSSLLLAGAVGIGWHSFDLLLATLQVSAPSVTTAAAAAGSTVAESHSFLSHSHGHGGVLDPNAAWFALASVIIKEWLYRVSKYRKREKDELRKRRLTEPICSHQGWSRRA